MILSFFSFLFTFMHLADAFIQSDLQRIQAIHVFSMCVPWEVNPQPFALLMQCFTTEPQEHRSYKVGISDTAAIHLHRTGFSATIDSFLLALCILLLIFAEITLNFLFSLRCCSCSVPALDMSLRERHSFKFGLHNVTIIFHLLYHSTIPLSFHSTI